MSLKIFFYYDKYESCYEYMSRSNQLLFNLQGFDWKLDSQSFSNRMVVTHKKNI